MTDTPDTPEGMDTLFASIRRLSDCLLASHPDTSRIGTVPEMMDAAVEEIERLREQARTGFWGRHAAQLLYENKELREVMSAGSELRERWIRRASRWLVQRDRFRRVAKAFKQQLIDYELSFPGHPDVLSRGATEFRDWVRELHARAEQAEAGITLWQNRIAEAGDMVEALQTSNEELNADLAQANRKLCALRLWIKDRDGIDLSHEETVQIERLYGGEEGKP